MGLFSSVGDFFSGAAKAIGGVLNPVSSIVSSVSGLSGLSGGYSQKDAINAQIQGQMATNAMNAQEAQYNRQWQQWMSSTAHQREVDDLRRAGLNPILSGTGGSGAAMGSGSMAVMKNPYEGTADAVNTAKRINEIEKRNLDQQDKRIENETELKTSTVKLNEKAAENQMMQAGAAYSQELKNAQEIESIYDTQLLTRQKVLSEMANRKLTEAAALEKMSGAQLNSAYAARAAAETGLRKFDLNEREYLHEIKKWTGPAREIFNTAGDAVDVVVPLRPKQYIRINP